MPSLRPTVISIASHLSRGVLRPLACTLAGFLLVSAASAQMQLPGATTPTEEGAKAAPGAKPKPKRAGPPPPPKVPTDDALLGRTLEQNGRVGVMQFGRDGKDLRLTRLTLAGEKISRAAETCTVEAAGAPFTPTSAGRPNGVTHYSIALAGCPFEFDVLDGAVLVAARPKACEFTSADCRVDPAGLWGQPAAEIGPARSKEIERARAPAEQVMRNHFRTWIESVAKDRDMVRRISRDQAGFSSRRAEICARYAREAEHGYCSLALTQARSTALAARVEPPPEAAPEPPPEGERRRKARP